MPAEKTRIFKLEHKNGIYNCELVPDTRNKSIHIRVEPTEEERFLAGPNIHKMTMDDINQEALFPEYKPGRTFVVRVAYPASLPRKAIIESIINQSTWIENEMQRLRTDAVGFSRKILTNGTPIPYLGQYLTLCLLPAKDGVPDVVKSDKALICHSNSVSQRELRSLVETWFKQQSFNLVKDRIDYLAVGLTNKPYKISVRSQRSRWGSCSMSGTLSFNWKLAMMPDFVIDYLIVHELAHLEEFNHSAQFWKLVKDKCKHVPKAKAWLKKHGPELE